MRSIRLTVNIFTALALLSCGKESQEVTPVAGFPEDGVVRLSTTVDGPETRANASEYAGATLGLFIDYGLGDKLTMNNVRWTKGAGNEWTSDKQMLWKNSSTAAKLYAYAPYVAGQNDPAKIVFFVPADQTEGTTAADIVTWPCGDFIPDNAKNADFTVDGKVLITFSHRLVNLIFNFEKGNQFDSDVTVKEATLLGTASKVVCDATFGLDPAVAAATDATGLDITLHKLGDLKYEAVFFPGNGQKAGAGMLRVTMSDGSVLRYVVPASGLGVSLMPGYAYEMKMRLGKDKIEVGSVSVADWAYSEGNDIPGGEAQTII